MTVYKLDYTIEKVLQSNPTREQKILRELVGKDYEKEEAKVLWAKIQDHKWYVGECLNRDVGMRVAAVDYVENFYEPTVKRQNRRNKKINQNVLSPITFAA